MIEISRRALLEACAGAALPRKGISLHLGLNCIDANHYKGDFDCLLGAEADAVLMAKICRHARFETTTILGKDVTRASVTTHVRAAARRLKAGDIFVITFAGHGSQLPDLGHDEIDSIDETWCLYDAQIRDDELLALWAEFAAGVRLVIISDSCHSGTANAITLAFERKALKVETAGQSSGGARALPFSAQTSTYLAHREFYDRTNVHPAPNPLCSIISLAACQDGQTAMDNFPNGDFTAALASVWNNNQFSGNYRAFLDAITELMTTTQRPNYQTDGAPQPAFEAQQIFFI
jgi:metacaspase-1